MTNPHALVEAQSASELFDVMHAPPTDGSFDIYRSKGIPTGEVKPRGLVHKDQDWHRSVHVWLVDRAAQRVALQKRSPNKVRARCGRQGRTRREQRMAEDRHPKRLCRFHEEETKQRRQCARAYGGDKCIDAQESCHLDSDSS